MKWLKQLEPMEYEKNIKIVGIQFFTQKITNIGQWVHLLAKQY